MKLTISKKELMKIYEGAKNSNNQEVIAIFNKVFGNKPSPNIVVEYEGSNTMITLGEEITIPLLDIISKNSYGVSQIITTNKNPLTILTKLRKIYNSVNREILNIFK